MVIHVFSIISAQQTDTSQELSNHLWVTENGRGLQLFASKKRNPKSMKALSIFWDPSVTLLPEETSHSKLRRACATTEFSFQAMI